METEIYKIGGWIGTVAFAVISGLLYLFPARRKQLDEATTKLIATLQETVGVLERDLNIYKEKTLQLEQHQRENIQKIDGLIAEKQLLRDFIAGRDKETATFQTEAMVLHRANSDKITQLTELLSKHFLNMEAAHLNK